AGNCASESSLRVHTHSMGRLPAGLRGYVRLPLHLTYLKPEAARSLFPRLTDCNQKRSTHFARSQNCLFVRCPSLPTLRPLADAFGARNFLRKYCRNRRGSDNFPATAIGSYERGAPPDPRTKRTVKNRAPAFRLRAPLEKSREGD